MKVQIRFWNSKEERDEFYRLRSSILQGNPLGHGIRKFVNASNALQVWNSTMDIDPNLLSFTKIDESLGEHANEIDHVLVRETAVGWFHSQ